LKVLYKFHFHLRGLAHLCLAASLSFAVLGDLSAGAAERTLPAAGPDFVARNATRYNNMPDLSSYGFKDIVVAYENSLWPAGADRSQPDTAFIANSYIPKIRNSKPDVVVIDIEAPEWRFTATMTAAQVTANINKFKRVLDVFRHELPNTKLGLYLIMPERNWLAVCGDPKKKASRTASWHERNLRLQPLADAVDIIFPSLYTFYEDAASVACWPTYAKKNIEEARMYGKPVWPFLWMKYHTTSNWIPAAQWRTQLETVAANADGLVIWSRSKDGEPWSFTAPWWVETAAFLSRSTAGSCSVRQPSSRLTACVEAIAPVLNKAAAAPAARASSGPAPKAMTSAKSSSSIVIVNTTETQPLGLGSGEDEDWAELDEVSESVPVQ
jgi:hypothetical protein